MKKVVFTGIFTILLHGYSYSQLVNYNNEGKKKILAEKTTITMIVESKPIEKEKQLGSVIAAAAVILPPVIDLIVNSAKEKIKKNALAYKGEYKGVYIGDGIYSNPEFIDLPRLTIKRIIKISQEKTDNAVEIDLIPQLSKDKTAFRYKVGEAFLYKYSIAKTKGEYNYIDVNININFKSLHVDKGEYKISELRNTTISIPMVFVGGDKTILSDSIYSGWIPLPPRSKIFSDTIVPIKETKFVTKAKIEYDSITSGEKELEKSIAKEVVAVIKNDVPQYKKLKDDTGLYEIEVTITETNPYKIKAENMQTIVESSSESSTAVLKAIIGFLTKEKEEDKEDE